MLTLELFLYPSLWIDIPRSILVVGLKLNAESIRLPQWLTFRCVTVKFSVDLRSIHMLRI